MSQTEKSLYFQALKNAGVTFSKHYREYSTETLRANYDALVAKGIIQVQAPAAEDGPSQPLFDVEAALADAPPSAPDRPTEGPTPEQILRDLQAAREQLLQEANANAPQPIQRRAADPNELAGQRLNSKAQDEPIREDEFGRIWYQEEVRKPAYPKARGRRVLRYLTKGTEQKTVREGVFSETFEVPGSGPEQSVEVKITLPSYQVGIYRDPRFPFKVYVYNEKTGFDYFEVMDYYGGPELVPGSIKKMYVENVLCYDIRTTIATIEAEYRALQLSGRI